MEIWEPEPWRELVVEDIEAESNWLDDRESLELVMELRELAMIVFMK